MTDDIEAGLPVHQRPSARQKIATMKCDSPATMILLQNTSNCGNGCMALTVGSSVSGSSATRLPRITRTPTIRCSFSMMSNKVYGGACLRISIPKHPVILDLEQDILPPGGKYYFSLPKHFRNWNWTNTPTRSSTASCCILRLRKGEATRRMFQAVLDRCIQYRVRYMFGIGDKVRTRLYKQIYNSFGLPAIPNGVDIPMREQYEGIKMYLIYGDMKRFHAMPSDPDADRLAATAPTITNSATDHPQHDFQKRGVDMDVFRPWRC